MADIRLDHATIDTADLDASIAFYRHFLNLEPGWRPPFCSSGAWLYSPGVDYAILHLIETPAPRGRSALNHIAFRTEGLADYIAKVRDSGGWFRAVPVPDTSFTQVHHLDPNGVKIEAIFDEALDVPEITSAAGPGEAGT